jgi:hypothetical protein
VTVVTVAWVLAPTVVERSHGGVVSRTYRTATCSGWQFDHYPPGTSDVAELVYCVGVEHPADG